MPKHGGVTSAHAYTHMYSTWIQWLHQPNTDVLSYTQAYKNTLGINTLITHTWCIRTVRVTQFPAPLRKWEVVACVVKRRREKGRYTSRVCGAWHHLFWGLWVAHNLRLQFGIWNYQTPFFFSFPFLFSFLLEMNSPTSARTNGQHSLQIHTEQTQTQTHTHTGALLLCGSASEGWVACKFNSLHYIIRSLQVAYFLKYLLPVSYFLSAPNRNSQKSTMHDMHRLCQLSQMCNVAKVRIKLHRDGGQKVSFTFNLKRHIFSDWVTSGSE